MAGSTGSGKTKIKFGINGLGRIGRCIVRVPADRRDSVLELAGINDLTGT